VSSHKNSRGTCTPMSQSAHVPHLFSAWPAPTDCTLIISTRASSLFSMASTHRLHTHYHASSSSHSNQQLPAHPFLITFAAAIKLRSSSACVCVCALWLWLYCNANAHTTMCIQMCKGVHVCVCVCAYVVCQPSFPLTLRAGLRRNPALSPAGHALERRKVR